MRSRFLKLVVLGVLPLGLVGVMSGCCHQRVDAPASHPQAVRIERHGLAAEFMPSIDRLTFFGERGGTNLLHTVELDRPVPEDGSYTFFGGCYTWVSPQKSLADAERPLGWVADDGTSRDWPPDPAMDVGPVRRIGWTPDSFAFVGPEQRTGLQEEKSFRLRGADLAEFSYTLRNRGINPVTAGCWITCAASTDDVIAVRMRPGTDVTGWDQANIDRFRSICSEPDARGWVKVNLSRAKWDGGVKVYLFDPSNTPEIAVWKPEAKKWLYRSMPRMSEGDVSRLRGVGEGPVAIYIQPGKEAIVEAELYGPVDAIAGGAEASTVELWRVIDAEDADLSSLP